MPAVDFEPVLAGRYLRAKLEKYHAQRQATGPAPSAVSDRSAR
jgi:hypothetical protein